jgi:cytochrome P450
LVAVIRHADVVDVFRRDSDFLVGPTNRERFMKINGPFVLSMDRGPALSHEHRAMYSALSNVDLKALSNAAADDAESILNAASGRIDAVQDYVWHICALTSQRMFGISNMDMPLFRYVARAMFYHIFFNANNDPKVTERAVIGGELLKGWLLDEMALRRESGELGDDFMGQLLRRPEVDDDMIRRTLASTLVGSIDTITGSTARLLVTIAKKPKLRAQLEASLGDPDRTAHYCMEGLRLWPHNPFLARQAAADTKIRGTNVAGGQKLMLMTSAAMFDPAAFPDPMKIMPDRSMASYLHFGLGVHACAGRALSELQVPMLVGKLLERDYRIDGKMKWAGPFPDSLPISFGGAA